MSSAGVIAGFTIAHLVALPGNKVLAVGARGTTVVIARLVLPQ